jgi:hypothetical protein
MCKEGVKMNPKLILSGVLAVVLLSGCASAPQAPKDAKELAEMGEDNLLHVPVDLTQFINNWKKVKIISEEDKDAGLFGFGRDGDIGQTTVWTNPADGKMYDLDGQPVNEKGERILKNGYVCKVRMIASNMRIYVNVVTGDQKIFDACMTSKAHKKRRSNQIAIFSTAALGVGALAVGIVATQIDMRTEDDTL